MLIHQQLALNSIELVLGSASPRRSALLNDMGLSFTQRVSRVEESYPSSLQAGKIALYLARLKANALRSTLTPSELLITSDTVVWCTNRSIEKPSSRAEAESMLEQLSGCTHMVYTALCLTSTARQEAQLAETQVTFSTLSPQEIDYYLDREDVLDKAGAYGIQDWIGLIGITEIKGSYFTVMGLPTHLLYQALNDWMNS
ncbi:MAG: Maf family nucleotide pyrophosphatase [Bacteroidetes bacterium]|nr:Maf family nucleotide pyrophosphatase [Bacteroidota bacterium]